MKFIRLMDIILLISLLIACGRPGGKSEDNATGSYLQVTEVSEVQNDRVTIKIKNIFKDSTVTSPNSLYNVKITSYTLTYFREDGSIILDSTKNNSIFIYIEVGGEAQATITLVPSPSSVSYSSASVYIFGTNGFDDRVGTTFNLPKLGGGTSTTTTTTTSNSPTVSSVSFNPSTVSAGASVTVTAIVTDPQGSGDISSVTIDASQVGAGSTIALSSAGGDTYTGSFTVASGTSAGSYTLTVTVTDKSGNTGSSSGTLTVQ